MILELKNGESINIRVRDIGSHLIVDARYEEEFMLWAHEQAGEWSVDSISFPTVLIFEKPKRDNEK